MRPLEVYPRGVVARISSRWFGRSVAAAAINLPNAKRIHAPDRRRVAHNGSRPVPQSFLRERSSATGCRAWSDGRPLSAHLGLEWASDGLTIELRPQTSFNCTTALLSRCVAARHSPRKAFKELAPSAFRALPRSWRPEGSGQDHSCRVPKHSCLSDLGIRRPASRQRQDRDRTLQVRIGRRRHGWQHSIGTIGAGPALCRNRGIRRACSAWAPLMRSEVDAVHEIATARLPRGDNQRRTIRSFVPTSFSSRSTCATLLKNPRSDRH